MTCAVVLASYNGEAYIREQLDSIIKQSKKPDKIIIIDDASLDQTAYIAKRILKESGIPFEVVINDNNLGPQKSFYKGIDYVTQDIVFFSDQDDVWDLSKIEKMHMLFQDNKNCSMVICDSYIWDNNGIHDSLHKRLGIDFKTDVDGKINIDWYWKQIICRNIITGMNMAIRKDVAEIIADEKILLHDMWYAMIAPIFGDIYVVNEKLVNYRQHSNNVKGANRIISRTKLKNSYEKVMSAYDKKKKKVDMIYELNEDYQMLTNDQKKYLDSFDKYLTLENELIRKGQLIRLIKLKKRSKYPHYAELDVRDLAVCVMCKAHIKK